MKKITIRGEDLARIPLWKELGKPKDDEEITLYQLEGNEGFPVELPVKPANGGLDIKQIEEMIITRIQFIIHSVIPTVHDNLIKKIADIIVMDMIIREGMTEITKLMNENRLSV